MTVSKTSKAGGYTDREAIQLAFLQLAGSDLQLVGIVIRPKMETFIVGWARHQRYV